MSSLIALALVFFFTSDADARGGLRCTRSINHDRPHCVEQRRRAAERQNQEKVDAAKLICPSPDAFKNIPHEWEAAFVRVPLDLGCPPVAIPAGWDCFPQRLSFGDRQILHIVVRRHAFSSWEEILRWFGYPPPVDFERPECP